MSAEKPRAYYLRKNAIEEVGKRENDVQNKN